MDDKALEDAVDSLLGDAVAQVLAEGRELSNRVVEEMLLLLSDGEPDIVREFALQLLNR